MLHCICSLFHDCFLCLFSPPATDFALKTSDCPDTEYPVRIMNNDRGCLWYKKDKKFKIPKGIIVFVSTFNISCLQCLIAKWIEWNVRKVSSCTSVLNYPAHTYVFSLFQQRTCGSTSYHLWFRSLPKSKLTIM